MNTQRPAGTPTPIAIPEDDFDEYLEWTLEEEEEFLKIINDPNNDGMNGATT